MTDKTILHKWLFSVLLVVFVLATTLAALNGPTMRHDDLWYMKDLQEFLGNGKMTSNQIFPAMIVNNTYNAPLVTHNLPSMYMAIPFVILAGPFWGWIVTNILFSLLACWLLICIGDILKWSLERRLLCGACFLLFPNTIYLASHPLSEAGSAFLVILICYLLLKMDETPWKWFLIGLITGLATLNRASLMVMAILILLYLILKKYKENNLSEMVLMISCFLFSFVTLMAIGKYLFPQADTGGVAELIKTSKDSNMELYYAMAPLNFSFEIFVKRVLFHLQNQLIGRKIYDLSFLLPFNALILWVLFKKAKDTGRHIHSLHYYAMALIVTHFATTVLFQFQYRYMQILYPVLLAYFFATFDAKRCAQVFEVGLSLYLVVCMTASAAYAKANYDEAGRVRNIIESYKPASEFLKGKGPILISANERIHRWVIPENPTLFVVAGASKDELLMMRKKVAFGWMICRSDSPLLDRLQSLEPVAIDEVLIPLDSYKLYRFRSEPS